MRWFMLLSNLALLSVSGLLPVLPTRKDTINVSPEWRLHTLRPLPYTDVRLCVSKQLDDAQCHRWERVTWVNEFTELIEYWEAYMAGNSGKDDALSFQSRTGLGIAFNNFQHSGQLCVCMPSGTPFIRRKNVDTQWVFILQRLYFKYTGKC